MTNILPTPKVTHIQEVTMSKIIDEVCAKHGVSRKILRSTSRDRKIVNARRECIERLKTETRLTLVEIGKLLNRHHSSVIHLMKETHFDDKQ